ncbi:MAG: hypothetical protein ACJ8F7_00835 [Gemmataceae bacterium]
MKWLIAWVVAALLSLAASAGEVGFIEDFALAKDRAEALKKLIPGTEDYYYYHALNYLNTEQYEKVDALVKPWRERFGQSPRLIEIQTRQALLTYDKNPQKALDYLRNRLGLQFNHQRVVTGGAPNLPVALDPKLISRTTLRADSLTRWATLDNFEDSALDWLAAEKLDWERRRNLLQRLQRPDVPDLPRLVAEDLASPHSPDFGAWAVQKQMTLAQLAELLKLTPVVLNQTAFIQTWLTKLQPGADEDWQHDPARTRAYLDRLLGFVRQLQPRENPLKAHVLYHRLALDRSQGTYDKALFLEYLALPRMQPYMSKALLESDKSRQFPADLNANFAQFTLLPVVGADEPLVRDYLAHFFLTADSPKEFEPFVNDVYLRHLFAETKIEAGLGDSEVWASQLPPELFRQLRERVDIDFAATNKTNFAADEPVKLDLFVKNVPALIVKVFEINTKSYYRTHRREVDTDVNLDGLVANAETTHTYAEPPLRRIGRKFEFPQLTKPGVYVIDFIGGGKSSRALVRKGRLRPLVTTGTAGQRVAVVDDANQPVKDAALWLGGQEYTADKDGTILVPFSTSPGREPIVLSRGDFACLDYLEHQAEEYRLVAGIHVDRESLLTQRIASVIIRPGLYLNGTPSSVKLLEEVRLRIVATDHDGIATATEVPNFKLFEDRESTHDFRVPPRLAALHVELLAKVKSLSQNKTVDLSAAEGFAVNGIDKTDKTEDLHLAKFGPHFVLELRGRTGEPKPDRPVQLSIKHRDFKQPVNVTLKTDAGGRLNLGELVDIDHVTATGPEGPAHTWNLPRDHHTYRPVIHARAGDIVTLPYLGSAATASREELALFEVVGSNIRADRFDALAVRNAMLEVRDLPAGDYDLYLKRQNERIRIRVVDGPVVRDFVLGQLRHLQLAALKPVQIESIAADEQFVTVRLRDISPFTRVHVFATRYEPAFSAFADLGKVRDAGLHGVLPAHAETVYLTGRNIGDEYRYVLDRRNQRKFPGNMLERPQLLLNPWVLRSTETGEQQAQAGEDFAAKGEPPPAKSMPAEAGGSNAGLGRLGEKGESDDLDFLADAAAVVVNLVPDKDGVVKLSRKEIGPHGRIRVVAVDPLNTTVRTLALPEVAPRIVDLRLRQGLDPKEHFTQQKQVNTLPPNQPFVVADAAASRFEVYDSLPKVFALYATLNNDPKLAEFSFILNWPKLKPEEKRTFYSKYACHELNFFLAKKDPAFFRAVVKPYLANKKDKTFLDRWLLEEDLSEYLKPWHYDRLNAVERILLAQRIAAEPAKTARALQDWLRLQPPNPDRARVLFETAVKGGELAPKATSFNRAIPPGDPLDPAARPAVMAPATPTSPMAGAGAAPKPGAKEEATKGSKAADDADILKHGLGKDGAKQREGRSGVREQSKMKLDKGKEVEAKVLEELEKAEDKPAEYFGDDRKKKAKLPAQLYRKVEVTQEWAENNYYHLPIEQQLAGLVPASDFWLDYARHDGKTPFLSKNLADASRTFTEMMFALSVLDLPFSPGKAEVKFDGNKMTYTPADLLIAFHEEVKPVGGVAGKVQILVSQNFYRHGDRYRDENGERFDKFVTGEFVQQTVYGCQVVVTNPSPSRQRLSVLVQIPTGAIPVGNGQYTKTVSLDLEPYHTQTIDYLFYFPRPGHFTHFPVHVAKNETLVAAAAPVTFDVVEKPSKLDTESWAYVSQNGSPEQVLAFLSRENVFALNLEMIAWRMRERDFFNAAIQLLQERHDYQPTLWSYALLHNALPAAREFLMHADQVVNEAGGPISSSLLTVNPVERYQYEHLEYKPLVNARTHSLGQRRQIVNGRLEEHYHHFLKLLSYRTRLTDDDQLAVCYYLLLQDRVEEALAAFAAVNPERVSTKIQYDYCAAYLDLYTDDPKSARQVAAKYAEHPVDRWRNAFRNILNQFDEIEGKGPQVADADDRAQRQANLAAREPGVEFTIDSRNINLAWQNVESARVNYYLMDVELLFSRNPFVAQSGGQFASIRPNFTQDVKLAANQSKMTLKLPEELVRRNVLVEISAAGKTRALPYYANAMDLKLNENYGQLRVVDGTGKALPKVYVKAYARLADGTVKFYKDGYTDLRGRFDYTSVSTPERAPVVRIALLVLSDDHGALIRETAPPQQ